MIITSLIKKMIEKKNGINPFFGDFAGAFDGFGEEDEDGSEAIKLATRKSMMKISNFGLC